VRILLVHNRYRSGAPSGENRVVDEEHRALGAAGHDVRRFERSNDEIRSLGLRHKALVPLGALWSRRSAQDLARTLAAFRPDVVHIHNVFPLLSPSVLGSCASAEVPCVVTLHNFCQVCVNGSLYRTGAPCTDCVGRRVPLPAVQHGCYRGSRAATAAPALSAVLNRRAWQTVPSAYLFLSRAQQATLAPAGLPAWRSFVKPNMVADPFDGEGSGGGDRAGRAPLVVYAGRLIEAKGVRTLLRGWERFSSGRSRPPATERPRLRLAIAGAGPLDDEVRAWARERHDVDVLGAVSPARCMELFRRAAAVVVPSEWQEPFGLVVAEAMAAGAVPIATDKGALPELIRDGVDGLLYRAGDAEALGALLGRIEGAPQALERVRTAARATYERTFAPTVVVAQLEGVYRFAIRHPSWFDPAGRPAASRRDDALPVRRAASPAASGTGRCPA
jgi:glycosyltransferase involved in cell wall biosynthesis